jgi:hypothetical protein
MLFCGGGGIFRLVEGFVVTTCVFSERGRVGMWDGGIFRLS